MFGRFLTRETLLLLALSLSVIAASAPLVGAGVAGALAAAFLLFAYVPLAVRLQDWLLERRLAKGDYDRALALAAVIRNGTRHARARALAEFDVGLVHLARGAPADAVRAFRSIESHRLQPQTRLLVALYQRLAALRVVAAEQSEATREAADGVIRAAEEAIAAFEGDATLLSAQGEALLALGRSAEAQALLRRSLQTDGDPMDPSPGERYLLFARAALDNGARETAMQALRIAAELKSRGPFVRAARAELQRLESLAA